MGTTHKDAGTGFDANAALVKAIRAAVESTYGPDVIPTPAGSAGAVALRPKDALFARSFRDPVLVACADGVGTKARIAVKMNRHDTIGVDLVAVNVNDLVTTGARPVLFVDHIAFSAVPDPVQVDLTRGMARGCLQAGCALLPGGRAELPGVYKPGEYDLAGFAVGVVERSRRVDGRKVEPGDTVIGAASSGLHASGYSLARKVLLDGAKLRPGERVEELGCTLGDELLRPTLIYARAARALLGHYRVKAGIKALAHVKRGGLPGSLPRVLPKNCSARISRSAWPKPPIFGLIQRLGEVDEGEMYRAFNMGIGLVLIVPPTYAQSVIRQLAHAGHKAYVIGRIRRGPNEVELVD